jgi:capsular polysaccharide biosynthesis protein
MSIEEQLHIIVQTDIFIGMHGAGLTHVLFLKSNSALIELTDSGFISRHFELMALINNVKYHHCSINDGASTAAQTIFDCITKKLFEMCPFMTT